MLQNFTSTLLKDAEIFVLYISIIFVRYLSIQHHTECVMTYTDKHLSDIPYSLGGGVVGPVKH